MTSVGTLFVVECSSLSLACGTSFFFSLYSMPREKTEKRKEKRGGEKRKEGMRSYVSFFANYGGAFFFNLFSNQATAREACACESVEWYCKSGFFFNWQLHEDAE